jgi:hypothetical protein
MAALSAVFAVGVSYAGEVSVADGGRFDITSRTAFGLDLDNTYRYGLTQELTKFNLILNLFPYQKLSNRVNSEEAVGFIDITLFHLDLMTSEDLGYNAGVPDDNGAYLRRNRFQTGEFLAGIAKGNWVFQMNAGANEPFWAPWNKGLAFVNDRVRFTWAYLDSMVDVKRTKRIYELKPEDELVEQYQQDGRGPTDSFGLDVSGPTVAALYNKEGSWGMNLKLATEYGYNSEAITESNRNGIAAGVDFVTTPEKVPGLKIFASAGGSADYGLDENADPVMVGFKVGRTFPLNEDISLEPFVGTDLGKKLGGEGPENPVEFEVSGGLTMRWPGQGGWYTDYILDDEGRVFPGMSLAYKVYGDTDKDAADYQHSVKFTLFEPRGDEGVFYGLGSEMIVDFVDIIADRRELITTVYVDYEIARFLKGRGTLIPWGTVCYDYLPGAEDQRNNAAKLNLGVKLRDAIANAVLGLEWNSGDILNPDAPYRSGYAKATVEIKY